MEVMVAVQSGTLFRTLRVQLKRRVSALAREFCGNGNRNPESLSAVRAISIKNHLQGHSGMCV